MKFELKDASKRWALDRRYLEAMKPKLHGCPNCGKKDGLKLSLDLDCNISVYCNYKIKCETCGYIQSQWHDSVAEAVKALQLEANDKLTGNNSEVQAR